MTSAVAMDIRDLRVELEDGKSIVQDVDLQIGKGEIVGLVGESGSGKSTTGLSILGYASPGARIAGGTFTIDGEELTPATQTRSYRGRVVTYVPQNPGTSLNPALRIVQSIEDILDAHLPPAERDPSVLPLLDDVGLPGTEEFGRRFPHQLSGGQQQRVCIAGSLACKPALVVMDEPTTGLDVITQARILEQMLRLRDEHGISILYITHDLGVVAQIADRVAVMYGGWIVEEGSTEQVLGNPRHPYTKGLAASIPDHSSRRSIEAMKGLAVSVEDRPAGCPFEPRCPSAVEECGVRVPAREQAPAGVVVRCIRWGDADEVAERPEFERRLATDAPVIFEARHLRAEHVSRAGRVVAADDVNFSLRKGECLALVGESGSGKSTIARTVAGLHPLAGGSLVLDDAPLRAGIRKRSVDQRRRIQMIAQNPSEALNPRQTVAEAIGRPAQVLRRLRGEALATEVDRLLGSVRLAARVGARYPGELSGGERQRVAIARALAAGPEILICDEVTSALDVSVQAAVLELLSNLQADLGVALLFITHDLGVVRQVADRVMVLQKGEIAEEGSADELLSNPQNPYTKRLLEAAPSLSEALEKKHAVPDLAMQLQHEGEKDLGTPND